VGRWIVFAKRRALKECSKGQGWVRWRDGLSFRARGRVMSIV